MRKLFGLFIFLLLIGAAFAGYYYLTDTQKPTVSLTPDRQYASLRKEYLVQVQDLGAGLKSLKVSVSQGQKESVLIDKTFAAKTAEVVEKFTLDSAGLRDGPFEMRIEATDRSIYNFWKGNVTKLTRSMLLDTTPPNVNILSSAHIVRQGGVGCVVYSINKDVAQSGVVIGERFFKGYKQDSGNYICLFAFPYDMHVSKFNPKLKVEDLSGTERLMPFRFTTIARKFKHDNINISDDFLNTKMTQYESTYPEIKSPLEMYLKVNGELRKKNLLQLQEIAKKTAPKPLWKTAFLRLPNAAPRAGYGDGRSYFYNGKKIDEQTHMGVDLASLENAQVPAANNGIVVYTGFFGIYGNCIIIDHGLGLQTLYSHLSQIRVQEGQEVARGDIIGNTGATGLAGGDHLHFGVLLDGIEVSPIEWWDQHFLDDNINGKFQ